MRGILAALFALVTWSGAIAADGANFAVIGYSPDNRYFAFEQYGVQDGSGFPYTDIFVLDLDRNEWVKGSPIREVIEDEEAKTGAVRRKAQGRAAALIKSLAIEEPADVLAANPATEAVADRTRMIFDRWYRSMGAGLEPSGASDEIRYELMIEDIKLDGPASCPKGYEDFFGFVLKQRSFKTGDTSVIHADTMIPESRACPLSYDIAAVVAPAGYTQNQRLVAIVGVYSHGFEGSDHRFIAVPFVPD